MARVAELARTRTVEVMTHPVDQIERGYLMGDSDLALRRRPRSSPSR